MSDNQSRRFPRPPLDRPGPDRAATPRSRPGAGTSAWPDLAARDAEPPQGSPPRPGYSTYRGPTDQSAHGQDAALPYGLGYQRHGHGKGGAQHPIQGMSKLLTQMFLVWRDMLGPLLPAETRWDAEPAEDNAPREVAYDSPPAVDYSSSPKRTRVTFDIKTTKRVEVSLALDLEQDVTALAVLDLVALVDPAKRGAPSKAPSVRPIQDVLLERAADGEVVVHMTIPADQPDGTYLGMIVDQARAEPRGDVRVRINP